MPRQPRANQNGVIFHHIMVQGINREYVFDNEILMSKYLELVLGCLSRFCNERQIQLSDILSNLNNLKSVIRYMKYDYKISYMHIMEIMKIPLNVMQTMKNK